MNLTSGLLEDSVTTLNRDSSYVLTNWSSIGCEGPRIRCSARRAKPRHRHRKAGVDLPVYFSASMRPCSCCSCCARLIAWTDCPSGSPSTTKDEHDTTRVGIVQQLSRYFNGMLPLSCLDVARASNPLDRDTNSLQSKSYS